MRSAASLVPWFLLAATGVSLAPASDEIKEKPVPRQAIARWLVLGPVAQPLPVFHDEARGGYALDRLLDATILPPAELAPEAGTEVAGFGAAPLRWTAREAGRSGSVALVAPPRPAGAPAVAWLASYLAVERFTRLALAIDSAHPARWWIDGSPVGTWTGKTDEADVAPQRQRTIDLAPGRHLLLVVAVLDPERKNPWTVTARIGPAVTTTIDPERPLELRDILDAPQVTAVAIEPRGTQVALAVKRILPGTHQEESWIEFIDARSGRPGDVWRGGVNVRLVDWSPDGKLISWVATDPPREAKAGGAAQDKPASLASLYVKDRETHEVRRLLEGVDEIQGYAWSRDARLVAYWTRERASKDERGVKRVEGLLDRRAEFRDKTRLGLVTVPGGVRRAVTAGALGATFQDFSPDGARLLFSRELDDVGARPYLRTELWELEIATLAGRKLRDFRWFQSACYAPGGRSLLIQAGPSEFDAVGFDQGETGVANDYDGQLYVWDVASGKVEPITRAFDPSVSSSVWSQRDGAIYFTAADGDQARLYRHAAGGPVTGTAVATGFDVLDRFDLAESAPFAVGLGSSPWQPQGIALIDLEQGQVRRLPHPADRWFEHVGRGSVQAWSFTTDSGVTIPGRVYYPPDFERTRKYPAIVYYYGGTLPVAREFGGRYPKEWWAARGYVVWVPQLSGAIGFGQARSALHVNDWGRTTSAEVIAGTRAFLAAHSYVDPARVGCIGASYGGFLTMLLATETDLFAAAVSHAGISSLASYWGEGYWGYSYSAVASAEAFPWNRRDVYVDQSPLFRADRTRVPILLTHGTSDTNVPVGESDQFYVALKLLGKPVEYVQVEGEDHWILDHAKRQVWASTLVAWFDRWLKGQPEWWDALYPAP